MIKDIPLDIPLLLREMLRSSRYTLNNTENIIHS